MKNNFTQILGYNLDKYNYLYALCDWETLLERNMNLDNFISMIKKFDVKIIQYRDKISDLALQKTNLIYLKKKVNIPLIINDKIELIHYADGLHLGQEDLSKIHKDKKIAILLLRKKMQNKLLGLSTHNEKEILEANTLDIDYIGLGAFRTSSTKDVKDILGHKISYLAKISKKPVCAIGGVHIDDKIKNIRFNVVGSALYKDKSSDKN